VSAAADNGTRIRALAEKGMSAAQIARELMLHPSTVTYWWRKLDLPPVAARRRISACQAARIRRLIRAGYSQNQITLVTGSRCTAIRRVAAEAGLLDRLAANGARANGRPARDGRTAHAARRCLACRAPFFSEGAHHRLCGNCRDGDGLPEQWAGF